MPLSADNPNRNRNFVLLILGGTICLAIVMAAYVAIDLAGRDTDSFVRFLTLLTVTLVPSVLGAWRAHVAAARAGEAITQVETVQEQLNGGLEPRITSAVHDALDERGAPGRRNDDLPTRSESAPATPPAPPAPTWSTGPTASTGTAVDL